ncbi:MAG: branched-chain amino acid transaminase [Nitrospinae bacterium]|nr:branched-chain amino acid transaminase [Nitrospinota bacterium]
MSEAPRSEKIWMDGHLVDWDQANVHVLTHTLHYGLGVFEGVRCYNTSAKGSAVFRLREHTRRLFDSAKIVGIEIPFTEERINAAVVETIRANNMKECYIRPLVFLGDNRRGVNPIGAKVRVAIAVWPWGAYLGEEALSKGIRIKTSSFARHHQNIFMTKAKICGAYVNSILAKVEAVKAGYDEALLLDPQGNVAEGSGENIFIVRRGRLKTPPLTSVLEGITRDSIITLANDQGLLVTEQYFSRDELYTADEAFFTGTAAELTPIRSLDDRQIGTGGIGPVTKKLQTAFFDAINGRDPKYAHWLTVV